MKTLPRAAVASLTATLLSLSACSRPDPPAPKPELTSRLEQLREEGGAGGIQFVDAAQAMGLDFVHQAGRSEDRRLPEVMGSGVAIADFNRDGAPDLLLIDSGDLMREGRVAPPPRLFLNDGTGRFEDVTEAWGLVGRGYGMGVAVGDHDNDGWPDVFLTGFGATERLLRNTGQSFVDVTEAAGFGVDEKWSTSAGFADLDLDGDLDLFITRYVSYDLDSAVPCATEGIPTSCSPLLYAPVPDRLWRNEGDGTFTNVSEQAGLPGRPGRGLALALGDLDLDGMPDVYVANDVSANALWAGAARLGLTDRAMSAGVALNEMGKEEAGMGVDFSDLVGDGRLAIVCTNYQGETNNLYRRPGDAAFFFDVSASAGIADVARTRLGFGVDFFDVDNDGDEDLMVANGHVNDKVALIDEGVSFGQTTSLFENVGGGHFKDISTSSGPLLALEDVSRGLATADLDGDGRLDVVLTTNDGPLRVGLNVTQDAGHFLGLWLEGKNTNRSAIGARIEARVGDTVLRREIMGSSSYLSVNDFRVHLGLGSHERVDSLVVHWPGGEAQDLGPLEADRYYYLIEGGSPQAFVPGANVLAPHERSTQGQLTTRSVGESSGRVLDPPAESAPKSPSTPDSSATAR